MNREIDLSEISDGKKYDAGDMARLGVNDCSGCHHCCCGMGDTVTLDPYDVYRLEAGLSMRFEELLSQHLGLRVADGMILPHLRMDKSIEVLDSKGKEAESEACTFLNEEGRCSIHSSRPAICRLFPLGRIYENDTHQYFLQVNECQKERQDKIKIKKWLDTPAFSNYEKYVDTWHYFVKGITDRAPEMPPEQLKAVNMAVLNTFFATNYDASVDFYEQFNDRMSRIGF